MLLAILCFHFKILAQIDSFLSLAITSCHFPYLAVPTIFHLYFRIPTVVCQFLTSCLPNRLPYFPVISKFCNAKKFPAHAIFTCHLKNIAQSHFLMTLSKNILAFSFSCNTSYVSSVFPKACPYAIFNLMLPLQIALFSRPYQISYR